MDSTSGLSAVTDADQDIGDVEAAFCRYAWSLDTKDWDALSLCFTEDMVFEASNMGRFVGPHALISAFQRRAVRIPVRRHAIMNQFVELRGNEAEVTSYLINTRVREGAPGGDFFMGGGYYRNTFRKCADGWRMAHLRFEATFLEGNPRLDPSLPATPYLPLMSEMADAPWPKPSARLERNDRQQIIDFVTATVRAADAGATNDVEGFLAPDAVASLRPGHHVKGADEIAPNLCRSGAQKLHQTFLTNLKVKLEGVGGRFSAYMYRVRSLDGRDVHEGGFLTCTLNRGPNGWRISSLIERLLWNRDEPQAKPPELFKSEDAQEAMTVFEANGAQVRTDSQQISALLAKYAWCYDFGRFDLMTDCFAADIDGSFLPAPGRYSGRQRLISALSGQRDKVPFSQHYLTNTVVRFDLGRKSADVRCYALTRRTPEAGGVVDMTGGRYDGHAELIDGEWRLTVFGYTRLHNGYH